MRDSRKQWQIVSLTVFANAYSGHRYLGQCLLDQLQRK